MTTSHNRTNDIRCLEDMKTVIVMVGLPARGKSTIAKQVKSAITDNCRIFNAGDKRRLSERDSKYQLENGIFRMSDPDSVRARDQIALESLQDLLLWLQDDANHRVAIFDATNSTRQRRRLVLETLRKHESPLKVIFLEVIVNSENILDEHLYWKVRHSNDYKHLEDKEWCISDFRSRMKEYEAVYETIRDDEFCSHHQDNLVISVFKVRNRFERCSFHGEGAPAFIYFLLLSLQRKWFLERNRHLPVSRHTVLRTSTSWLAPRTWLKLRKLT